MSLWELQNHPWRVVSSISTLTGGCLLCQGPLSSEAWYTRVHPCFPHESSELAGSVEVSRCADMPSTLESVLAETRAEGFEVTSVLRRSWTGALAGLPFKPMKKRPESMGSFQSTGK